MNTSTASPPIILTRRDHDRLSWWLDGSDAKYPAQVSTVMQEELERASIVPSRAVPPNIVTMNSHVAIRDRGEIREFILVYPGAEDSAIGNLSILTSLGVAILGAAEGDTVSWTTFQGKTGEVVIDEILYQPEADGQFDV